jgi:malate dehydrogenase
MVDVMEGIPQGKALDQWESAPIEGFDSRIIGSNGYEESRDSDIVVITAGIARKPGMSRDDTMPMSPSSEISIWKPAARAAHTRLASSAALPI